MKTINTYGGHLVAYGLALLALVAGADPALLGPHGLIIVGVAGAVVGALSHANTAVSQPGSTSVGFSPGVKAVVISLLLAGAVLSPLVLVGCKTAPTQSQAAGIAAAVDVAVGAAVQNGSSDSAVWKAKAQRFEDIARQVKSLDSADFTSLAAFANDIQPVLDKLGPADALAAHAVIAALVPFLQQTIAANPTVATTQAAINAVLQDVINACALYTGD